MRFGSLSPEPRTGLRFKGLGFRVSAYCLCSPKGPGAQWLNISEFGTSNSLPSVS